MSKKLFRKIALVIVPFLASVLIRLLSLTTKKEFFAPKSISDDATIFACWHGELLMLPYLYFRYRKKPNAKVVISNHFDGLLISKTVKYFGLETIAGSSNRNPVKVLIQALKALRAGIDIGITPDGPKGPAYEVADGIIIMAQKTKSKIMLFRIRPSSYWQLNSWDDFIIPKPFSTLRYYATEPLDISDMGLEEARIFIKKGLDNYEI